MQYIAKKKVFSAFLQDFHELSLCFQRFLSQYGVKGMVKHYKS